MTTGQSFLLLAASRAIVLLLLAAFVARQLPRRTGAVGPTELAYGRITAPLLIALLVLDAASSFLKDSIPTDLLQYATDICILVHFVGIVIIRAATDRRSKLSDRAISASRR